MSARCQHGYHGDDDCAGCWPIYLPLSIYCDTSMRIMLDVIVSEPTGSPMQVEFLRHLRHAVRATRGSDARLLRSTP